MKNILLSALLILATFSSHSQSSVGIKSKEQAIDVLRASNFILIYRWAEEDISKSVELFVNEIDKIRPLGNVVRENIELQLNGFIDSEGSDHTKWLMGWSVLYRYPFIGEIVSDILNDSFSTEESAHILEQLTENLKTATDAYDYLTLVHMKEQNGVVRGIISSPEYIDNVYDYFGI